MNILMSNSALRHCRRDHYSLQKCRKIRIAPRPPYWGGATAPLPRLHPFGAPALRTYAPLSPPWFIPFDISKYATV